MNISSDLLKHEVLSFLKYQDVAEFADVCRRFRCIARSLEVWRSRMVPKMCVNAKTVAKFADVAGHIDITIGKQERAPYAFWTRVVNAGGCPNATSLHLSIDRVLSSQLSSLLDFALFPRLQCLRLYPCTADVDQHAFLANLLMKAVSANRLPELRSITMKPCVPWFLVEPILTHCPQFERVSYLPSKPFTYAMVRGIDMASARGVHIDMRRFSDADVTALWRALPPTTILPFRFMTIKFKRDAASLAECVDSLIQAEHMTSQLDGLNLFIKVDVSEDILPRMLIRCRNLKSLTIHFPPLESVGLVHGHLHALLASIRQMPWLLMVTIFWIVRPLAGDFRFEMCAYDHCFCVRANRRDLTAGLDISALMPGWEAVAAVD